MRAYENPYISDVNETVLHMKLGENKPRMFVKSLDGFLKRARFDFFSMCKLDTRKLWKDCFFAERTWSIANK